MEFSSKLLALFFMESDIQIGQLFHDFEGFAVHITIIEVNCASTLKLQT